MPIAHLNIGSNIGNRRDNIIKGVDALRRLLAVSTDTKAADTIAMSDFVESEPWGYESTNKFLNLGINIETSLPPLDLLDITQQAQSLVCDAPHRADDGSTYIDRTIDIDIIFYGNLRINHPRLTLPHPRAIDRDFVITPLLQLNPHYPLSLLTP